MINTIELDYAAILTRIMCFDTTGKFLSGRQLRSYPEIALCA